MKKILGIDLGTTSIGWAIVEQSENTEEKSSIIKAGVRVNPLSVDEKDSFEKGKSISTNAARTLKRGMRRNLQRYKQRRNNLMSYLKSLGWISEGDIMSENGRNSTWDTFEIRSKSASEKVSLSELARVLLNINGKRGYKSNRKTDAFEEGSFVSDIEVAKILAKKNISPAEYSYSLILEGSTYKPQYYFSDIQKEYDRIWEIQKKYYPEILTDEFKDQLIHQNGKGTSSVFLAKYGIFTADNKGKDRRVQALKWRVDALKFKVEQEVLAYVIASLRSELSSSSNYLGSISDRSKELYFQGKTVGQYLYEHLLADSKYSTRNKVFYRQDYIDEFETIWKTQSKYHNELTDDIKTKIKDEIIFYQRELKSQKNLISYCEFESKPVEVVVDGKKKIKVRGCRVAPKSSLVFQEFKIWQILNNLTISDREGNLETRFLSQEEKTVLADALTFCQKMKQSDALKLIGQNPRKTELNYEMLEGNVTMYQLYKAFLVIVAQSGHENCDIDKTSADRIKEIVSCVFEMLGFNNAVLKFDTSLEKKDFEQQPLFKLWHLLYSYQGDSSVTGDVSLVSKIAAICKMPTEYARIIAQVKFSDDYGSLSHKALMKILPYLKDGNKYDVACTLAGYNHSHSLTSEELDKKEMKDHLEVLPKGALRNPVVEKIVNQMINVVNQVSAEYGKPDEIHIELARELKMNAAQRADKVVEIEDRTRQNEAITKILKEEFHLPSVHKKDILRYRLYCELKDNGYKSLYSNREIHIDQIFSHDIDIEHIIPQARLFDDSYSNKTLEFRDVNIEKGKRTACDYIRDKYGEEGLQEYKNRINDLASRGVISRTKRKNLLMTESDIPSDFLERDLTMSQYIAKKSMEILKSYVHNVVPTVGSITAKLRSDWQLVDVMKELNLPKYSHMGMVYKECHGEDGNLVTKIEDWTKRNDHRHHAMDALTIAFTKPSHIQILNNLNARGDRSSSIYDIFRNETIQTDNGWIFAPPMPLNELRSAFKRELESVLVSIKAKNKVVSRNINRTKCKGGFNSKVELSVRGQLHKEQVYGLRKQYETYYTTVGNSLTREVIDCVASKTERLALLARLEEYGGDSKKAFTGRNSLEKNPIYIDDSHTRRIPAKVKCVRQVEMFCIRKDIGPDLNVSKVLDRRVKLILMNRLTEFGGNQRKAFSNLDENPIWLNKDKGIVMKRVTIAENLPLVALHDKRDKDGRRILDEKGNTIPVDYVNLRNNHHVAIYKDADGNFQELVVPVFDALQRVSQGLPAVDKNYNAELGWQFVFSMKNNEMFVFPDEDSAFVPSEIDLMNPDNYAEISKHLYRLQKASSRDYWFRHHLETTLNDDNRLKDVVWKRINSTSNLNGVVKVRINHIGKIVYVGEYD